MGADPARMLLRRYRPDDGTWAVPLDGPFWDAVAALHARGERGGGRRVAVIDAGFDTTLPSLAGAHLHSPGLNSPSAHGTVVALLLLTVAPDVELHLHPVPTAGTDLDDDALAEAVRQCTDDPVDVVNLSLGRAHPLPPLEIAALGRMLQHGDWRREMPPPPDPLSDAVRPLLEAGTTVLAAVGNHAGHLYAPASAEGVLAVAFQREERAVDESTGTDEAFARPPSYGQAHMADLSLRQPARVLGSSFATPLMTGLAAITDPRALAAYARAIGFASTAAWCMATLSRTDPPSEVDRAVDDLVAGAFDRALERLPHQHTIGDPPCPACQVLAVDIYVNAGLMAMYLGRHDRAGRLLRIATSIAPGQPDAQANLRVLERLTTGS